MNRRTFLGGAVAATTVSGLSRQQIYGQAQEPSAALGVTIDQVRGDEDIPRFIQRTRGSFDEEHYAARAGHEIDGRGIADRLERGRRAQPELPAGRHHGHR